MRIALLTNYYPEHVGGVETVGATLAGIYRAAGNEVRWLAADVAEARHAGHRDDRPLPAWNVTERRFGFPWPVPGLRALWRLWRAAGWCDVVHAHDCLYAAHVAAALFAWMRRRPLLLTQHTRPGGLARPALNRLQALAFASVGAFVFHRAARVVCNTPAVADYVRGRTGQAEVVENPLDATRFSPVGAGEREALRAGLGLRAESPAVLFVGRFVEHKGVDVLRSAAAATPDWQWRLIGWGDDLRPEAWGLPNVTVLRRVPPDVLVAHYRACDLLALFSRVPPEAFGLAVQEAMACGTPAVVRWQLADVLRVTEGLFVADPDSAGFTGELEAIAGRVSNDQGLRARVAEAAHRRWAAAPAARYLELLAELSG